MTYILLIIWIELTKFTIYVWANIVDVINGNICIINKPIQFWLI